jgi:hypothetical protein
MFRQSSKVQMLARAHILLVVYWRLPTTFVCRKFRRLFLRSMEVLFVLFIPYKNPRRQKFWSRSEQLNFPWGINITSLSPNRYPTHSSRPTFRRNTSLAFKPSSLLAPREGFLARETLKQSLSTKFLCQAGLICDYCSWGLPPTG